MSLLPCLYACAIALGILTDTEQQCSWTKSNRRYPQSNLTRNHYHTGRDSSVASQPVTQSECLSLSQTIWVPREDFERDRLAPVKTQFKVVTRWPDLEPLDLSQMQRTRWALRLDFDMTIGHADYSWQDTEKEKCMQVLLWMLGNIPWTENPGTQL